MSLRTLAGFELEGEGCSRKGKGGGDGANRTKRWGLVQRWERKPSEAEFLCEVKI